MSGSVVADAVTAANIVAKLPFWAELDTEAVLATFREKHLPQSSDLTIESLQALFYALNFDKQPKGAKAAAEVAADAEDAPAVEGEDGEVPPADVGALAEGEESAESPAEAPAESTEAPAEAPADAPAETSSEAPAVDGDAAPTAEGEDAPLATEAGDAAAVAAVTDAVDDAAGASAVATEGATSEPVATAQIAAPPAVVAPPAPPTNAAIVWNAVVGANATSVDGAVLISKLALYKNGFGDATLRFAVKAQDHAGAGCLSEAALWRALTLAANAPLSAAHRTHLRKVWRGAEKYQKPEEEAPADEEAPAEAEAAEAPAEEGGEGEGDAPAAAPPAPAETAPPAAAPVPEETKAMTDAFLTALTEDEVLAAIFARDVAVPIEAPPEEEAAEEGEE